MRLIATTICGTGIDVLRGDYLVERGLTIGHEPIGVIGKRAPAFAATASGEPGADTDSLTGEQVIDVPGHHVDRLRREASQSGRTPGRLRQAAQGGHIRTKLM
jgi:hypothetical protein